MIVAGSMKFMAGKLMLVGVGSMALSLINIQNDWLALTLGAIAATIEILWGISFAFGCRLTSKWAALGLSIVMAVALTFKLVNLPPMSGSFFCENCLNSRKYTSRSPLYSLYFFTRRSISSKVGAVWDAALLLLLVAQQGLRNSFSSDLTKNTPVWECF
jgi:hypothetical protein